jgi:hypothetical protein
VVDSSPTSSLDLDNEDQSSTSSDGGSNPQSDITARPNSTPVFPLNSYKNFEKDKRRFRYFSFGVAWILALFFFGLTFYLALHGSQLLSKAFEQPSALYAASASPTTDVAATKLVPSTTTKNAHVVESKKTPEQKNDHHDDMGYIMTHYLLLLSLIAAVSVTLSIGVMKFSFANEDSNSSPSATSPTVSALVEFIKGLVDTFKK